MKKMFLLAMVVVVILGFTLPSLAVSFSDVSKDAWYYEYVTKLTDDGVINGYPDGTYKPDDGVTVGAFLKLIMMASTGDGVKYNLVEPDYDHWAAPYLKVAENYRVLEKGEYTQKDLDRAITRIEIVKILARCDIMIKETLQTASDKQFTDTADLSDDEIAYLSHAVGVGVISGDAGTGTFRPHDGLKRSECAKVIYAYTNR